MFRIANVLAFNLLLGSAVAQVPDLPPQWFSNRSPGDVGAGMSFCVDERIAGWEVSESVARALADVLLLDADFVPVNRTLHSEADYETLYFDLVDRCTVYLGFKLYADAYPDWLVLTRPLYEARFVMLTVDSDVVELTDIDPGTPIGVVQGSMGDIRFLTYNNSLSSEQRWRRVPLGEPSLALGALLRGVVEALIIWEPDWVELRDEAPRYGDFHVMDTPLISEPWIGVSAALLADRVFEQTLLDEGLAALTEDGTIAAILKSHGFPGRAPMP